MTQPVKDGGSKAGIALMGAATWLESVRGVILPGTGVQSYSCAPGRLIRLYVRDLPRMKWKISTTTAITSSR